MRLLAFAWLAFLVSLSVSKSLGYGHWAWGSIEQFLGGDLQMHFVLAFILSVLAHLATEPYWKRGWLLLFLIFGCLLDEGFQWMIPLRNFEILDFLITCMGLISGFLSFVWIRKWQANKKLDVK